MKIPKIKLIIFDFDDTLYEGETWKYWGEYISEMINSLYDNKKDCKAFAKKYGIVGGSTNQYMAQCVANEFGSTQKFVDFMKNVFYQLDEPNLKVIENDYLKKLSKKVKLAIVSNSSRNYLLHYLKRFKIDESNFEYILQNEYEMTNYSKGVKYELLLKTLNLNPQEALVIGDNYETDIKPALSMNINAVHTHNLESVKKAVSQFIEF